MATVTAAHPPPRPSPEQSARRQPPSSPSPSFQSYPLEVDLDEAWIKQLKEEQNRRLEEQAKVLWHDLLAQLDRAGPFAPPEIRNSIQRRYDERLAQIRAIQQEDLDQAIEMERQLRLQSLGLEDKSWGGWNEVIQDQTAILANIRRSTAIDDSIQEKIRENEFEAEEVRRRAEVFQKTEAQRAIDRARWSEHQRLTTAHLNERRQRDLAETESKESEARMREEHLRETLSESMASSRADSAFFAAPTNTDTPPSSVYTERWRPSPPIPIPTPSHREDRASPVGDLPRPSSARSSPPSSTPTSNTMAYAKGEEATRPAVWIPPATAREQVPKSSISEGGGPTRKASGFFNMQPPSRKPSVQFASWTQEGYSRNTPPHSAPLPHQQPPNAPPLRPTPLPTPPPSYTTTSHHPPQSQSQSYTRVNVPPQPRKSETRTPPRTVPPATTNSTPEKTSQSAGIHPSRPSSVPLSQKPTPVSTPSQNSPSEDAEERRRKLRDEYKAKESSRIEEERRRRDEEMNRKRADEARRRGAEKRRAEEEAREAERKEAERRARAAGTLPAKSVDIPELWAAYESQWAAMASAAQLRFRSIPWPVSVQVTEPAGLLPVQIAAFVLSPGHSQGKTRKDRLREALLRWHPDRFESKWLRKVAEEDREAVKEGVGLVVRALNELLSAEGTFAA